MSEANRIPFTVRLKPEDRDLLIAAAEESKIELGLAARMILEIFVKRLQAGQPFLSALAEWDSDLRAHDASRDNFESVRRELQALWERLDSAQSNPTVETQRPRSGQRGKP